MDCSCVDSTHGYSIFWDLDEKSFNTKGDKTSTMVSTGQGRNVLMLNTLLPPRAKKQEKEDEELDRVDQKEPPLAKLITKACHCHQ